MTAEREPWRRTTEGVVVSCRLTPKGGRDAIDGVAELADGSSVLAARVRSAPARRRSQSCFVCAVGGAARRPGLGRADRRWLEEPAEAGRGFGRSCGPCREARSAVGESARTSLDPPKRRG